MHPLLSGILPSLIPTTEKATLSSQICQPRAFLPIYDRFSATTSGNEMALKMYDLSRKESQNQNIIFSPLSILFAVNLLYPGSQGKTKEEITNFLSGSRSYDLMTGYSRLFKIVEEDGKNKGFLHMANKVFAQEGFNIKENYTNAINQCFNTDAFEQMDFKKEAEKCRNAINSYVEEATKNRIKDLLPVGSVNYKTRLVLINSLYFKAAWDVPFIQNSETVEYAFANLDGTKSPMKYMNPDEHRHYFYTDKKVGTVHLQVLGIPYKEDFDMFFVLPDNFTAFEAMDGKYKLLDELIVAANKNFVSVDALVPKFTLNYEMPLKNVLKKAGVEEMFSKTRANFRGISAPLIGNLYVGGAFHKGFIQVNENGTEAAAATGVSISPLVSLPQRRFRPTTPFLFLIQHRHTQSILFLGAILKAPKE